jgi:hypothetical protein
MDQGLTGGPRQEGPDDIGVDDVGQLIALPGEAPDVLARESPLTSVGSSLDLRSSQGVCRCPRNFPQRSPLGPPSFESGWAEGASAMFVLS